MPSMVQKDLERADWRHASACLEEDPELFFPIGNSGPALEQLAEAKAVCAGCPVLADCLEWALSHSLLTDHGVWGGMSEDERRTELRRRRRRGDTAGVAA